MRARRRLARVQGKGSRVLRYIGAAGQLAILPAQEHAIGVAGKAGGSGRRVLAAMAAVGAIELKDIGGKNLAAARNLDTHACRAQQLGIGALRGQRLGQVQVDLAFDLAGARARDAGAQVDPTVIIGGAVVFCLLKHRGIAGGVVLRTSRKAVEVKGRDRVERHAVARVGGKGRVALLRPAAGVGVAQLQHQLGRVAMHAHRVGVDLHVAREPRIGRSAQGGGEHHHDERDVGACATGVAAGGGVSARGLAAV